MFIFGSIWALSVQFPYMIEERLELPDVAPSDAFLLLSAVPTWSTWSSSIAIEGLKDQEVNSGDVLVVAPSALAIGASMPHTVRVTRVNHEERALCWSYEQVWPFLLGTHCSNVTSLHAAEMENELAKIAEEYPEADPTYALEDSDEARDAAANRLLEMDDRVAAVVARYSDRNGAVVTHHEEVTGPVAFFFFVFDPLSRVYAELNREFAQYFAEHHGDLPEGVAKAASPSHDDDE